jgi:hypothetical protein
MLYGMLTRTAINKNDYAVYDPVNFCNWSTIQSTFHTSIYFSMFLHVTTWSSHP